LFATHDLGYGVPTRRDWISAQQKAQGLLSKRGRDLLAGLGYEVEEMPGQASVLRVGKTKVAVAIFLDRQEACDVASDHFGGVSPVSYALAKADAENLSYVFVNHGSALRIYPAATGIGTGRRGRTETFIEVHLDLLPSDKAGYLWLLFSGKALSKGGTFEEILNRSADYAADLGQRLRERIYNEVVPNLAMAIVQARQMSRPTAQDLATTYEMALTVLFRLLFIAYAEDKELLPYRTNDRYKTRSLKRKARELADLKQSDNVEFDYSSTHWEEFMRLCRAINNGHREWGIPEYNGGLFSEEKNISAIGAELATLSVPNELFGPILMNLLVDETLEGFGPVDFRSLGVREFGTIYEGLLENELSIAEVDLTTVIVNNKELYVPISKGKKPIVHKGEVYLHNLAERWEFNFRRNTVTYPASLLPIGYPLIKYLEKSSKLAHIYGSLTGRLYLKVIKKKPCILTSTSALIKTRLEEYAPAWQAIDIIGRIEDTGGIPPAGGGICISIHISGAMEKTLDKWVILLVLQRVNLVLIYYRFTSHLLGLYYLVYSFTPSGVK